MSLIQLVEQLEKDIESAKETIADARASVDKLRQELEKLKKELSKSEVLRLQIPSCAVGLCAPIDRNPSVRQKRSCRRSAPPCRASMMSSRSSSV